MPHKLVFNIERIGRKKLIAQRRHDLRLGGDLSHTDPLRRRSNIPLHGSGDCVADVDAVMTSKGVKVRKDNEAPYTRVVLSASPDLFNDAARASRWVEDSVGFLRETWGDGFAYAVLHLDEKTPHIHAVVVPIVESKRGPISSHHTHPATKGLNSYERLRRSASARLDLDYGTPGNRPQSLAAREAASIVSQANAHAIGMMDTVDQEWGRVRAARAAADKEREALEQERQALKRERAQQRIRAEALATEAQRLGQTKIAARARSLSPSLPRARER